MGNSKAQILIKKISAIFFLLFSLSSFGQEICNNSIDDDADGLIDLNDTVDCVCGSTATPTVASLIPNPSFETINFCPSSHSQLNGASGWVQATGATSDYMNTCGYIFPAAVSAGLVPFPSGNGIVGGYIMQDYKEYIGACLLSPMTAGTSYKITFDIASTPCDPQNDTHLQTGGILYGPVDITIYGAANCSSLPVAGTYDCPSSASSAWSILGTVSYTPQASWGTASITFTPSININTMMIGGPCNPPASYPSVSTMPTYYPYFYFDNLILNNSALFGAINVSSTGHYCTDNIVLTANVTTTITAGAIYQWYLNGIAIPGANSTTYNVPVGAAGLGNYQVRLTDGSSCSLSTKFNVTSAPPIIAVNSPTICSASTTTLSANSFCNTYTWSTGATTNSIAVTPSSSTNYTVTGSLGTCTSQAIAQVIVYTSTLSITGNTLVCSGQTTSLTANGATYFSWDEPLGSFTLNNPFFQVVISTPFITTTYTVNGTATIGNTSCTGQAIVTVSVLPTPTISVSPNPIDLCPGKTATLTAFVSGASTYTWNTGANTSTISVNPTVNTVYTVSTSSGSCTVNAFAYVNMSGNTNLFVNSPTICYGQTATLTASGATSYTWSNGPTVSSQTVSPLTTTTYTISGENGLSCAATATATVSVIHPIANYSGINDISFPVGTVLDLINQSSNASSYKWELCDGTVSVNTNVSFSLKDTGNCCIKLIAFEFPCTDSTTKCFKIVPESSIVIPNVFTPNGDNRNEYFKVISTGLRSLNCAIYDRWGLKMYEWDGVNGFWDGKAKSGLAPSGTYFFIINYTDVENNSKTEKGFLSLFRD